MMKDFEKQLSELSSKINAWDKNEIYKLAANIKQLKNLCNAQGTKIDDVIDMCNLPSYPICSVATGYPVWAMDINGNCLVGEEADSIEHISEILI